MPQMTKYGEARELLIEARRLLEAEHSALAASACLHAALAAQRSREIDDSVELAMQALPLGFPSTRSTCRCWACSSHAGQDPLNVIANITGPDRHLRRATTRRTCPGLVFSVGFLAYPQDPSLGMEYISRAVQLGREFLGETHSCVARMQQMVGDVGSRGGGDRRFS